MGSLVGYAVPLAALLAVSACGQVPAADTDKPQRYRATGTVLENEQHGPQLCALVDASYPPQCGGPDVVGWDWAQLKSESAYGVRWGEYRLVGTYGGERFTLTEPAKPAPTVAPGDAYHSVLPCDEPAGGWQPVDESKTTEKRVDQAIYRARSAADSAGAWLAHPDADGLDPDDPQAQQIMTDPMQQVLVLSFTGDLDGRMEWIREVWGGALCLTSAEYKYTDLRRIADQVIKREGAIGAGVNEPDNRVDFEVYRATDALQAELDEKYGKGAVHISGWLKPVE